MAEWATSNDDLIEVRSLAVSNPDINTRVRAIMSIAISSIKSSGNKSLLLNVLNNNEEPGEVRQDALNGLNTYPLPGAKLSSLQAFKQEINAGNYYGTSGADYLIGCPCDDKIWGYGVGYRIIRQNGNDSIAGNNGWDTIFGGSIT